MAGEADVLVGADDGGAPEVPPSGLHFGVEVWLEGVRQSAVVGMPLAAMLTLCRLCVRKGMALTSESCAAASMVHTASSTETAHRTGVGAMVGMEALWRWP